MLVRQRRGKKRKAMPDPNIPLHCPKCPRALIYLESLTSDEGTLLDTDLYACPEHGGWRRLPNGRLQPNPHK